MLEYFPRNKKNGELIVPKTNQLKALDLLSSSNKKFVIFSAPTGVGKSLFGKTYGNYSRSPSNNYLDLVDSGKINKIDDITKKFIHEDEVYREPSHGCFVLTPTIALQNQLDKDFDTVVLKGKSHYSCNIESNKFANDAPCIFSGRQKKICLRDKWCDYYNTLDDALISKFSCLSYDKYLSLPDVFKRRQILVLDEAADIENIIVKSYTFVLDTDILKKEKINFIYNPKTLVEDLSECYESANNKVKKYKAFIKSNKKAAKKTIDSYNALYAVSIGIERLLKIYEHNKNSYHIKKVDSDITFTPLNIDIFCQEIFRHAEKVILMSATFIDIKRYAKRLGLKQSDYDVVSISNGFDPKKSLIYATGWSINKNTFNVNFKDFKSKQIRDKIVTELDLLLTHHKDEKGVIHTQNHDITKFIRNQSINPNSILYKHKNRLLIRARGEFKNTDLIELHTRSDQPTVLVSPSMKTGIDLKDDLGRFQIIIKCPYMSLIDDRVKIMSSKDPDWYELEMLKEIIQACGRTTRSAEDSSSTYILDSNFVRAYENHIRKIDKSFKDRVRIHKKLQRK